MSAKWKGLVPLHIARIPAEPVLQQMLDTPEAITAMKEPLATMLGVQRGEAFLVADDDLMKVVLPQVAGVAGHSRQSTGG